MEDFLQRGRKVREAAIIQQALIHRMNKPSCILFPTVTVFPDGMMVNKPEMDLHFRVCNPLTDKI